MLGIEVSLAVHWVLMTGGKVQDELPVRFVLRVFEEESVVIGGNVHEALDANIAGLDGF